MIDTLLDLTVRGTLVFILVMAGEALVSSSIQAKGRRWWWLCVPLGFLICWKVPILQQRGGIVASEKVFSLWETALPSVSRFSASTSHHLIDGLVLIWALGAAVSLLILFRRTWRVSSEWARERLSTDGSVLALLEECKALAGVTAPIGLVLTDRLETPAILGWLRPRILLPRLMVESLEPGQLAHVFLHELAHFRSMDIPVGWAFALVRCIHWFNPFAYLAEHGWIRFREEMADEKAMDWSTGISLESYGDTLMVMIRHTHAPLPFGALGITETFPNLKRRLLMITKYQNKTMKPIFTFGAFVLLALFAAVRPVSAQDADPKAAAVSAMEVWLKGIDAGKYPESWTSAAPSFQGAVSSAKWLEALDGVRKPLGECKSRKLISAAHQTADTGPNGAVSKADYVIAQFDTSFANMAYAVETVTFESDNGTWKAAGYFIKPK